MIKEKIMNFINGSGKMFKEFKHDFEVCQKEFGTDWIKWSPNILSSCRLTFIPAIAFLGLTGNTLAAAIVAIITFTTDGIDGFLARKLKCTSEFGRKLDAVADKLLGMAMSIALLPTMPMFIIPLGIEAAITAINWNAQNKELSPKTHLIGKLKTVLLYLTLGAAMLSPHLEVLKQFIPVMFGSTITLQALTMSKYYKDLKDNSIINDELPSEDKEELIDNTKEIDSKEYLKNYKESLNINEKNIQKVKKI